jgi:hypothetical protein
MFSAKESRIANCAMWWQCRASSVQIQLIGYCLNQKKCLLGQPTSTDCTDFLSLQAFFCFGWVYFVLWIYWLCLLAIVGLYETRPEFCPPLNFASVSQHLLIMIMCSFFVVCSFAWQNWSYADSICHRAPWWHSDTKSNIWCKDGSIHHKLCPS